jgi:predicted DNA-binding transcriptional regulator AlpA
MTFPGPGRPTTSEAHATVAGLINDHNRLLATPLAAEFIGMSPSWLEHDRLKTKPEVPYVKIGARAVRYRVVDLLAVGKLGIAA